VSVIYPESIQELSDIIPPRSVTPTQFRHTSPFMPIDPKSPIENLKDLFSTFSDQLGTTQFHDAQFTTHFSLYEKSDRALQSADLSRVCTDYLQLLGDEDLLVKLLKATCNQAIVSPVWIHMKLQILKDFPFKDTKHGWKIYVLFYEEEIHVIHQKKEQGHNKESKKLEFSFVWELKLIFTSRLEKLKSVNYGITDLSITVDMDPEKSNILRSKLKNWRVTTFVPNSSPRKSLKKPTINTTVIKRVVIVSHITELPIESNEDSGSPNTETRKRQPT